MNDPTVHVPSGDGPSSDVLVSITDVRRTFGDVVALDGVSLDIHQNEFFALLGPSGCGKTTLLRILAGLEQPDSGAVALDGSDLLSVPTHRRPINLMFQSYALFPHLNVEKNVGYGLAREKRPRDEIRTRVADVLETVGLRGLEKRRPSELSGGQRQRVALARAIVKRPRLLLLDEPLGALDRKIRAQMQMELKRLQHEVGITFVVVTHDQEEAMSMADRIAVMHHGRLEQLAPPVELYERPRSLFVADFIGSTNLLPGRVATGMVELTLGLSWPLPVAEFDDGDSVTVSVRPEQLTLVPEDDGELRGEIVDVNFFGGVSHVSVRIGGRAEPVVVARPGSTTHRAGERVGVHVPVADVIVLPG
jgi:spermidine/putrescine ABC transporter ATP-binding subunit